MINSISFKANYIKPVTVTKCNTNKDADVSLVELNTKDKNDLNALSDIATDWGHLPGGSLAHQIYRVATKDVEYDDVKKEHYYVITTQKSKFKNLQSKKILGVGVFSQMKGDADELSWLQINPREKYGVKKRSYKHIGTAMINYMKGTFNKKPIYVNSEDDAVEFYKKNKFKQERENYSYKLIWNS